MRMVVDECSADCLRLRLRSQDAIYFTVGAMFLGLGWVAIWMLGFRAQIDFRNGQLGYSQNYLGLWTPAPLTWDATQIEAVETETVHCGIYASLEVMIRAGGRTTTLFLPAADGEEKERVAAQLQRLLTAGETPISPAPVEGPDGVRRTEMPAASAWSYRNGHPGLGMGMGLVCLGAGLVCWSVMQRIELVAQRSAGQLTIHRRVWLWPLTRTISQSFESLERIQREKFTLRTGSHHTSSYHVFVIGSQRHRIALSFLPMFTDQSSAQLLSVVKTWLRQKRSPHKSPRAERRH